MDLPTSTASLKHTDSLIFDLDGTLWDAAATCSRAWNKVFSEFGLEYQMDAAQVRAVSGLRVETIFEEHFPFISEAQRTPIFEAYKREEKVFMSKHGGQLFPAVKETLSLLHTQYQLFVVSNCLTGYIETFLSSHDLASFFTDFECSGNTGKPKSDNIASIIERNALHFPVYVGDTIWDYEATLPNQIPFIFAGYGFGKVPEADFVIHQFSDLGNLFGKRETPASDGR